MKINKDSFLEGLKNQFEDSDAKNLKFDIKFLELRTWDSLTRFSIIAFVEDDYGIVLNSKQLETLETPEDLYSFIKKNIENK